MDIFSQIASAAHSGAAGINNLAPPSVEQIRAGNYKKGRFKLHGFPFAIETPAGTRRTGKTDGQPWSVLCMAHYGYIEGIKGADGDELDAYVGPWPESEMVYIVNRQNYEGGFDEHKCLFAFPDKESAVRAYVNSYERGHAGLGSVVPLSLDQFRYWVKNGDLSKPLTADQLPYDGFTAMNNVVWDSTAQPVGTSIAGVLYALRRNDPSALMLDAVCLQDVLQASEGEVVLDALVIPYNRLERKMGQMQIIMRAAGKTVKPVAMQITPPFKMKGTTQVAVIYELSDGQTITVFFHNPDATPNRITPDDEMVSWKWLLNKKDVTIVVAPERGMDLSPREVARRIMRLVEANSARFQKANTKRAERLANIETLRTSVNAKEATLGELQAEIETLSMRVQEQRNKAPATLQANDLDGNRPDVVATAEIEPAVVQSTDPDADIVTALVEMIRSGSGQVAKINTGLYFTFPYEGEDLIFTDELRAKTEAALGESIKEARLPGLEAQLSLVPTSWAIPGAPVESGEGAAALPVGEDTAESPSADVMTPPPISENPMQDEIAHTEVVEAAVDPGASAKVFLEGVIAGTEDLSDAYLADRLTEIYNTFNGDPVFDALLAAAIDAYQGYMVGMAKRAMG